MQEWHRSNYLVTADDIVDVHPTKVFFDSDVLYNVRTFYLESAVDQEVYISLYSYGDLQYVSSCYETFLNSELYIGSDKHEDVW